MDLDLLARHFANTTTPLLRVDFSDDDAWRRLLGAVTQPVDFDADGESGDDGYVPNIQPVEDRALDGATAEFVAASWDRGREDTGYLLLADARSMREAGVGGEMTLVYVDLSPTEEDEEEFGWPYGRSFRCAVDEIASIEANLSIANMDFADFADFADSAADDGVFRGFEE